MGRIGPVCFTFSGYSFALSDILHPYERGLLGCSCSFGWLTLHWVWVLVSVRCPSTHVLRSHLEQRRLVYVGLMAMISTGVMALGLWY